MFLSKLAIMTDKTDDITNSSKENANEIKTLVDSSHNFHATLNRIFRINNLIELF